MTHPILPVILSGGSGTRLWPLSRGLYPKQFMDLGGDTLFARTARRALAVPGVGECLVVCNEQHRFFASGILKELGANARIILEPMQRNTAPATALAALAVLSSPDSSPAPSPAPPSAPEPLLLVLPSDHSITDQETFARAIDAAAPRAAEGKLVAFGIVPTQPETGFGYILPGEQSGPGFTVRRFTEKPDKATAERLLAEEALWNSGIFLFRASIFLEELKIFAPAMLEACQTAWAKHHRDQKFFRPDAEAFAASPSDSIDYAVMEHTKRAFVVPLPLAWSDLGSWSAFHAAGPHDEAGNTRVGDVVCLDSRDCYLHSTNRLVAALGLSNVAVLETADAVLVVEQSRTGEVKRLVEQLSHAGREETQIHTRVFRPWGWYERLASGEHYQVKRIMLNPEASISLQFHKQRAEHWVVVHGAARVTMGEKTLLMNENESVYIPAKTVHKLKNPGPLPLEIIETQTGSYLGEDDIVRLEDVYGRI